MRRAFLRATVLVVAVFGCKPTGEDIYNALPAVGSLLPPFRYVARDGGSIVTPESLRVSPAVVALWSTTCSASRLAIASLGALHSEYAPRGARVVILADDRDTTAVDMLLSRASVRAPVAVTARTLMDTFTHGQSMLPWRKAFALPTFLVLDASGRVVFRQIGIEPDARYQLNRVRAHLDSLLALPKTDARR
jgi:hypothetical protein